MYCPHCGKVIDDKAALCPFCGKVVNDTALMRPAAAPAPVPVVQNNSFAIAGIILAFFIPFVGLILSIVGCKNSKDLGGKGKGLSIAGIILSIVMFVVQTILLVVLVGGVISCVDDCNASMSNCTVDCNYGNCDVNW